MKTKLIACPVLPLVIFIFTFGSVKGQFVNVTYSQSIYHTYEGDNEMAGGNVSFYDWDNDGWDDLTFANYMANPQFYHNNNGTFELVDPFILLTAPVKQILWVDYDNDGDPDLSVTCYNGQNKLYKNMGMGQFVDSTVESGLPIATWLTYTFTWSDFNNDSYLDVYIANYNGPSFGQAGITNYLYVNDGDGTFTNVTSPTGVGNGFHYSMQATFFDYNGDNLDDLFVINDRTTCPNNLYRNNGDGSFTDVSTEAGVLEYIFSMSNSIADYDNDGDFDIYISNNPTGHLLHRNNGDGTFTEVASEVGLAVMDFGWACNWFDANNDGYQDVFNSISPFWSNPGQQRFYSNLGNGYFLETTDQVGFNNYHRSSRCNAVGDFNNDGKYDLALSNDAGFDSNLWQNNIDAGNYIKVDVVGTTTNKEGIGTTIKCYADSLSQMRRKNCGESYMTQNSQHFIFGIGDFNVVDSLFIRWTNGWVDKFYNIPASTNLDVEEGETFTNSISIEGSNVICSSTDTIWIDAGEFESYEWQDGFSGRYYPATEAGDYFVSVTHEYGYTAVSNTIQLFVDDVSIDSIVSIEPSCSGFSDGTIELAISDFNPDNLSWSDGSSAIIRTDLPAGIYSFEYTDNNGCVESGNIELEEPHLFWVDFSVADISCFGKADGFIQFDSTNAETVHILWENGSQEEIMGPGIEAGVYSYIATNENGCEVVGQYEIMEPAQLIANISTTPVVCFGENSGSATIDITGGTPSYEIDWSGQNPDELQVGEYNFSVIDNHGCSAYGTYVITGPSELISAITVLDCSLNTATFEASAVGGTPPYEIVWSTGDISWILSGDIEQVAAVITDSNGCVSSIEETCVGVDEIVSLYASIYPNPASDNITFESVSTGFEVKIFGSNGSLIECLRTTDSRLSVNSNQWSDGLYMALISNGNTHLSIPFVVQH